MRHKASILPTRIILRHETRISPPPALETSLNLQPIHSAASENRPQQSLRETYPPTRKDRHKIIISLARRSHGSHRQCTPNPKIDPGPQSLNTEKMRELRTNPPSNKLSSCATTPPRGMPRAAPPAQLLGSSACRKAPSTNRSNSPNRKRGNLSEPNPEEGPEICGDRRSPWQRALHGNRGEFEIAPRIESRRRQLRARASERSIVNAPLSERRSVAGTRRPEPQLLLLLQITTSIAPRHDLTRPCPPGPARPLSPRPANP